MNTCQYAQSLKCEGCCKPYVQCKKFMLQHMRYLSRDIRPFTKVQVPDFSIGFSRDANKIKSVALNSALKYNTPVRKFTISQVMSLQLGDDYAYEDKVVLIDYTQKQQGDATKIMGVLQSFIDRLTLKNSCVYLLLGTGIVSPKDMPQC